MEPNFNYFYLINYSTDLLVNSQQEHPLPVGIMLNLQRMCYISLEGSDHNFRYKVKPSLLVDLQARSP